MRKSALLVVSVVVGSLSLMACSGGEDADVGAQASAQSAVERCAGRFMCDGTIETRLERHSDGCYAGELRLDPDGRAIADDLTASWHTTADGFELCVEGGCLQCVSTDPKPSAASAANTGKCTGSPRSCQGRLAGSCGTQRGCYMSSHVRWNGDLEYECGGSPSSCSSFLAEASCNNQDGCFWE